MGLYRVTRTIVGGQFDNDSCFTSWLEGLDHSVAYAVDMRLDPLSPSAWKAAGMVIPANLSDAAIAVLAPPIYVAGKLVQAAAMANADVAKMQEHRYYLWYQNAPVKTMVCPKSDPDLVTSGGKDGWATEAEGRAVLNAQIAQSATVAKLVEDANQKALSPSNNAKQALQDFGKDVNAALPKNPASLLTYVAEGLIALGIAWGGVKIYQARKR